MDKGFSLSCQALALVRLLSLSVPETPGSPAARTGGLPARL